MVAAATTTATRGFFAALFGFSRGLSKSTAALAALFASGGVAARFSREHDPQDDDRRDQEDCAQEQSPLPQSGPRRFDTRQHGVKGFNGG
jgi:hypothetical protein